MAFRLKQHHSLVGCVDAHKPAFYWSEAIRTATLSPLTLPGYRRLFHPASPSLYSQAQQQQQQHDKQAACIHGPPFSSLQRRQLLLLKKERHGIKQQSMTVPMYQAHVVPCHSCCGSSRIGLGLHGWQQFHKYTYRPTEDWYPIAKYFC